MFGRSFGVFAALAVLGLSAISLGATYGGGSGTAGDPYQIWTPQQLNTIGANSADWGKCFILMADIDMSAYTGTQYKIIGNTTTRFTGIFDGNKHVIRNLTYSTSDSGNYVGLFGYTYNAAIKNLGLENATISTGGFLAGCLVGRQEGGSITNCYTTGSVASISSGTSSVYSIAGGLAGSLLNTTMTHCCSTASVLCSSYTNSTNSLASCVAGGLVGRSTQSSITSSYSTGSITAESTSLYQSTINCGGLVGVSNSSTITNCYSTGWITAPSSHSTLTSTIGGLAGVEVEGAISSGSFWDMDTSGLTAGLGHGSSTGLTGKTTAEMQDLSTFISSGWDFSAEDGDGPDWYMSAGSYPQLKWMEAVVVPDVVGLSLSDTPSVLNPIGLFVSSLSTVYNSNIPEGTIISQTPAAGQTVFNDTGLNLVISLGAGMAGTGTAQDPYQIWTAEQMYSVGLSSAKWSKNFILMADIDMSAYSGNLYQPIGKSVVMNSLTNPFSGTFDGNGHVIRNLNISNTSSAVNYTGLFGYTQSATIKNLHLENISIFSGSRFVGGLVGYQVGGSITNCSSTGTITAEIFVGDSMYNYSEYAGGLVGLQENGSILNCISTCSVKASSSLTSPSGFNLIVYAGGLAGKSYGTIMDCYSTGSVTSSNVGVANAGGLAGNSSGTITFCYSTGSITASALYTFNSLAVGGLIGDNSGTITSCYAKGSVTGKGTSIGGLAGNNEGMVSCCYATGAVSGTGSYIGGLMGSNEDIVTSCFWDVQSSGKNIGVGSGSSAGMTGQTTNQMKMVSAFVSAGWDFSVTDGDIADWNMPADSYPQLKWQQWIVVPDVAGLPMTDAFLALDSAGLMGILTFARSDSVPKWTVISQSPSVGQTVSGITAVNLVVSIGPSLPGLGTAENPYEIWTAEQMHSIGFVPEEWNKKFILMADIDMSDYTETRYALIGDSSRPFSGIFDGNGHTLSNLIINQPTMNSVGLFGDVGSSGTIKNLRIVNANIDGYGSVGGLVGNNSGTISSCIAQEVDAGTGYFVGGLAGQNSGKIKFCYATGVVGGSSCVGGVVGRNLNDAIVAFCYGAVSVVSSDSSLYSTSAGGLVGYNHVGTITSCYATGAVNGGGSYTGGLVGYNYNGTISGCYSTGPVSGKSGLGGLAGGNSGAIKSCFWDIETSGLAASTGGSGVQGKTTVEMQTVSTFTDAGWDFSIIDGDAADWQMPANSYPQLQCMQTIAVPDAVGMSMANAQSTMKSVGLFIGSISTIYSDSIPEGTIAGQTPSAGQIVSAVTPVNLVLSLGTGLTGSGTVIDPYQIWTDVQLYSLGLYSDRWDKCSILMADIDMSAYTGQFAKMIGNSSIPFTGTFDGNGHVIRNIINISNNDYVGVFGYLGNGGCVKNLGVMDIEIQGRHYVGGLAGYSQNGAIIHSCFVTGKAKGAGNYIGGLVGWNGGVIHSCDTSSDVSGIGTIGGLAGCSLGMISFSHAAGAVNGSGSYAGGLVGQNSWGVIRSCFASGNVSGDSYIGGLIGYSGYGTIESCYATGTVTGRNFGAGGLVGGNYENGVITCCYAMGTVSGKSGVGGLAGGNYSNSLISSCFSTGAVTGTGDNVGGLTGINSSGTVNTCFWDIETSGLAVSVGGNGAQGKTTVEMQTLSMFTNAGWDFAGETANGTLDHWRMCVDGADYPRLSWEFGSGGDFACPDGVGVEDLEALATRWLTAEGQAGYSAACDANSDGKIDMADFEALAGNWMAD